MSMNPDGTGTCDRCGRHLPNTGVAYAMALCAMTIDGMAWVGHLCTILPDPCVDIVITSDDLANLVASKGMPDYYSQEVPA